MMKSTLRALRAITSEYLLSLLKPIALTGATIFGLCIAAIIFLTINYDGLWLLALFIVVPVASVAVAVFGIIWIATKHLEPKKMTIDERYAVKDFTNKATGIVESMTGPWPATIVTVAKDVLRDRESSVLTEVIRNTASLQSDFVALQQMFNRARNSNDRS